MTDHSHVDVLVCGFNGFQQIDHATQDRIIELQSPTVKLVGGRGSVCDTPVICRGLTLTEIPHLVFTWSNIWLLHGAGQIHVFGFRDEDISKLLSDSKLHPTAVVCQGHDAIIGSRTPAGKRSISLLEDGGELKDVKCDVENLIISAATETHIYGLKDGVLQRGRLVKEEEQLSLRLTVPSPSLHVASVACGVDHTLILTHTGTVYSCGSDSRGQLGHGDTSVDLLHSPTLVEALLGVTMVTIATGGWHSAAVTACGDLYVWGWNEAGQLGLPNGSTDRHDEPTQGTLTVDTQHAPTQGTPPVDTQHTSTSLPLALNSDATPGLQAHQHSASRERADLPASSAGRPVRLLQDIDAVLIQTVPYGLDIPNDARVRKVACGSRHTCLLLDGDCVMTAGWNKYGQLGLGHTDSLDFLQTVELPPGTRVLDIQAGSWTTAIITGPQTA